MRSFLLALILGGPLIASAQQRPLPDGVFAGIRWLEGSSEPVPLRSNRDVNDHVLGRGWGGMIVFSRELTERTGWTLESGLWMFKGRHDQLTLFGERFNDRAVLLPVLAGYSITLLNKGMLNVYLELHGGVCYGQYITDYEEQGRRVESRLDPIYGPHLVVNLNIFRLPNGYRTGPRFGISYLRLPQRSIRALGASLW